MEGHPFPKKNKSLDKKVQRAQRSPNGELVRKGCRLCPSLSIYLPTFVLRPRLLKGTILNPKCHPIVSPKPKCHADAQRL